MSSTHLTTPSIISNILASRAFQKYRSCMVHMGSESIGQESASRGRGGGRGGDHMPIVNQSLLLVENIAGMKQFQELPVKQWRRYLDFLGTMHRAMVRVMIEINSPPVRWLLCNYNHNGGCAHSRGALQRGSFTVNKCINSGKLVVHTKSQCMERLKHSSKLKCANCAHQT